MARTIVLEQFEQQHLASLGPSLSRLSQALAEFTETLRKSQAAVSETSVSSGELY